MPGNLIQVGSSDGKIRISCDGIQIAGPGDPCCLSGSCCTLSSPAASPWSISRTVTGVVSTGCQDSTLQEVLTPSFPAVKLKSGCFLGAAIVSGSWSDGFDNTRYGFDPDFPLCDPNFTIINGPFFAGSSSSSESFSGVVPVYACSRPAVFSTGTVVANGSKATSSPDGFGGVIARSGSYTATSQFYGIIGNDGTNYAITFFRTSITRSFSGDFSSGYKYSSNGIGQNFNTISPGVFRGRFSRILSNQLESGIPGIMGVSTGFESEANDATL